MKGDCSPVLSVFGDKLLLKINPIVMLCNAIRSALLMCLKVKLPFQTD